MQRAAECLRDRLQRHLAAHQRVTVEDGELRHAAVSVVVVEDAMGDASFVLTRRATGMRAHRGQWALPGGRVDDGEGVEGAALRELAEEVALHGVEILGLLDDYPTRSGYRITPVVVWGGTDPALQPNPAEVAAIYRIPLTELERPDSPRFVSMPETDRPVIQVPVGDRLIHAPTAAVLFQFREVGLHGRGTRVAHFDQPPFAWQ